MIGRLKAAASQLETRTLVLWIALAGAPWLFLVLADTVGEGGADAFDRAILLGLRSPGNISDPLGPRWFEESMRDITALGGFTWLVALGIVATLMLLSYRRRREAVVFLATMILAQVSSEVLKAFYDRDRPDLVTHGSHVYSQSFPSGHSVMVAASLLTLATVLADIEMDRRIRMLMYAIAMLVVVSVGCSRVYLGVHWPTDVLGGWALGASWALAARLVLRFARRSAGGPGEQP